MREERLMETDNEPGFFECIMAIGIIILLGYVVEKFDNKMDPKPAYKGIIFLNISNHKTDVVGEFTKMYKNMFIELTAFYNFSFIVMYQLNKTMIQYDYLCDNVDYCLTKYTFVPNYDIVRFLIKVSHQNHDIIKGGYYFYL